jgi:hypothetical protein
VLTEAQVIALEKAKTAQSANRTIVLYSVWRNEAKDINDFRRRFPASCPAQSENGGGPGCGCGSADRRENRRQLVNPIRPEISPCLAQIQPPTARVAPEPRVRAAHRDYWQAESRPEEWLLIEWPEGEKSPTKYWFSTLPADIPFRQLVDTAKLRSALAH